MTRFTDSLESGYVGITSAASNRSGAIMARRKRFTGGGNITWTGQFPAGVEAVTATLHILANGSAATSDRLTLIASAGGGGGLAATTTLVTFSSFGSAVGRASATTAGLATVAVNVSGSWQVGSYSGDPNAFTPFTAILSSVDTATDYGLSITFRRPFKPGN